MGNNSNGKLWFFRELFYSKAFNELNKTGIKVLIHFHLKTEYVKVKSLNNERWIPNPDKHISFTYKEANKRLGISKPVFSKALTDLIEHGFIIQTHLGGGLQGDYSKFELSEMWKLYGKNDFEIKPREKSVRKIGFMRKK